MCMDDEERTYTNGRSGKAEQYIRKVACGYNETNRRV